MSVFSCGSRGWEMLQVYVRGPRRIIEELVEELHYGSKPTSVTDDVLEIDFTNQEDELGTIQTRHLKLKEIVERYPVLKIAGAYGSERDFVSVFYSKVGSAEITNNSCCFFWPKDDYEVFCFEPFNKWRRNAEDIQSGECVRQYYRGFPWADDWAKTDESLWC